MTTGQRRQKQHNIESIRPSRGIIWRFKDIHRPLRAFGRREAGILRFTPIFMELARFLLSDTPFFFLFFFFLHLITAEVTLMLHQEKSIQHSFFGLRSFDGLLSIFSSSFLYIHINALAYTSMILIDDHFTTKATHEYKSDCIKLHDNIPHSLTDDD
jgi:hypothetical protein